MKSIIVLRAILVTQILTQSFVLINQNDFKMTVVDTIQV